MASIGKRLNLLLSLCGVMAVMFLLNYPTQFQLLQFGILPRHVERLWGIYTSPFLHASFAHLFNNCIGLLIFGSLALLRSQRFFIVSSFFIVTVGGLMVWAFGREANHIGASGWVFGLWSLTIAMAWVDRRFWSIAIAIAVIFFYGGMIYGVLPRDARVSFEAHLFGACAGIIFALAFGRRYRLT